MVTRIPVPTLSNLESAIIRDPLVVSPDTLVMAAIEKMAGGSQAFAQNESSRQLAGRDNCSDDYILAERSSCVVVVDAGCVRGLLTESDVVRLSTQQLRLDSVSMREVVTPPVATLYESEFTSGDIAFNLLQRHHIRHLPILDEHNHLTGLLTQGTLQLLFNFQQNQLSGNTEPALIHRDARHRAVLDTIPDYLFCVDSQGIYREVVTYQQGITLFPANLDPVGLSMAEVLPKELAKQQLRYVQAALCTGELQTYEHQIRLADQVRDEEVRVIKTGDDEVLVMIRDISDRKQAERQLQSLIEGTAATTGQDFFPALVRHIASTLSVAYAMVTQLVDDKLHVLAFWANGALHPHIPYDPAKTPCELTLQAGRFYCDGLVQQYFPDDLDLIEMDADSYLGIALYNAQGNAIGDLCILDTQPIQAPERAEAILQAFAARATAELERQRAISELEQLNQSLETKVAERTAELQEREQFLQTVLDTFPISVFWKDRNSIYLGCNRNCLQDMGVTEVTDIIGQTDFDIPRNRSEAEDYQANDRQVMTSNRPKLGIIKTRVRSEDGKRIWIETNKLPLHNLSGDVVGVLGTYQDITERKQLERDLQNSQKQMREVLDSEIAGITRFRFYPDVSIQYDYISPHCEQNFGYTADELFPDAGLWQSKINPDDWEQVVLPTLQAILGTRGTSTHRMEYRFHRKDGSICWILANCFVRWHNAGSYWYVTVVDTDISDRKTAESQLQNLILGTAAIGQDFFPALVKHIAEALDVAYVFVTECIDNELHGLAVWANGELQQNDVYPLVNTPCQQAVQDGIFYCERAVQQQFSDYLALCDMAVESYLGIALQDTQGNVIGILCVFDQQPLQDIQRIRQILQIFAARAAAELERKRANLALEQLNQALEAKVAERTAELQEREQFLQTVLDTFPLNVFWKDQNSVFLGANRNFLNNAGLASLADIKGKTDYDLPWRQGEAAAYRADDRQVMVGNTPKLSIVETQQKADGQQIWIETNKLPLHNLEGDVIGVLGTFQDITARKVAEAAIKLQLEAIEAAIDGIGILQNDTYLYVNRAHLDLFGYEHPQELVGKSWQVLYSPQEVQRFEQDIFPGLIRDGAWQGEAVATRKDGSTFIEGLSLTLTDDGLKICVCRDISDLKQVQEQIVHNAWHDPLTDLPNRALLVERINLAIGRAQRVTNYRYAVLFLDLDRFKLINDSLGHVVGDKLLIEVSKRLLVHLRKTDMVARLGGDEFVLLLEDLDNIEDIIQIVERILADCQTPIFIDEHQIFISISIGIAVGNQDYTQASNIIRDADIAMYRAKSQENTFYKFFDAVMYAEAMSRLTLETDLRQALKHQQLILAYQPIVNLCNQQLVGFEALVRWRHPNRGLISPCEFIPIAEETGLIMALDSWVIHHACNQIACWQNQFPHHEPFKVSINLSAQDLYRVNLLGEIDHILHSTGLTGDLITFEITESMLVEDINQTIDLLSQLASRQIKISIDDFGTGYSSLSYLHRLPIHSLKIDRSFVGNMHLENRNYQVVSTILALGQQLGLTVVAEGIETSHHLEQLQQMSCELGQGNFFSHPLAACEVETILSSKIMPRLWASR